MSVSSEQARQSIGFLNQFLERLRQQKDVNVLNMFTFAEVANLHVSMVRLNTHFSEQAPVPVPAPTQVQPQVPTQVPQLHTI
jgi:hypothetical protein